MPFDLKKLIEQRLKGYEVEPGRLKEDASGEAAVLAGGYGYRQVIELVQNGADAILEESETQGDVVADGRIHVQLHGKLLYVANTGAPLGAEGVDALLRLNTSPKRGNQIGRFGIGFKSLLKFNGRIDILMRKNGGIRFDPERCRTELRERFGVDRVPALRLAWLLGPEEREADPVCTELRWAETIVRVEVASDGLLAYVREEIRQFPAEFLLFFPVPTTLTLMDDGHERREIRRVDEGEDRILYDQESVSRWRVVERDVPVTDPGAREDAGEIHNRESVPLTWALPLEGRREESGRFWAFFPTKTPTYLPGILNAPWKLNSDRNAIIGGAFNNFLMHAAANLIADSLANLSSLDDPARPLDAFPRRMDRKDDDAVELVETLWEKLTAAAVVPDATGALRGALELLRHPKGISSKLASEWQSLAAGEQQRQFVHPSCLDRQRDSRLDALAERIEPPNPDDKQPCLNRCEPASWFARIASSEIATARGVFNLAESFARSSSSYEWDSMRPKLVIIPTPSGHLVAAPKAVLTPGDVSIPGREPVVAELQSDADARRILAEVLKVQEPDEKVWRDILYETLRGIPRTSNSQEAGTVWTMFWARLRAAPEGVRKAFLEDFRDEIHIRRRDGHWVKADGVLFPGALVSEDSPLPNLKVLVDPDMHGGDEGLLRILGVEESPTGNTGSTEFRSIRYDHPLDAWREECRRHYKATHENPALQDYLQPSKFTMPRGYGLLEELTGLPKGRLTLELIERLGEFSRAVDFGHCTVKSYPRIDVSHPLAWFLLRHGEVVTSPASTAPLCALIARRNEQILAHMPDWTRIVMVFDRLEPVVPVVPVNSGHLAAMWHAAFDAFATVDALQGDSLDDLWLGAARDGVVPEALPSHAGHVSLDEIFVTTSSDLARRARTHNRIVIVLDASTMGLWLSKGARDLAGLIRARWEGLEGLPEPLSDVVPELGDVLREDALESARCQRVTRLQIEIGDTAQAVPCLMSDGSLLLDAGQLARLSRSERLRHLLEEVAPVGWLNTSLQDAIKCLGDADMEQRRSYVAQGATLAERLLRAVGDRDEPLQQALGETLGNQDFVRQCTKPQLAELVLAQLGPTALFALKATLQEEGLNPPGRWTSATALPFVASLGFPEEFASSANVRREPEELINGPIELPPLHDYQQEVFDGLKTLLAGSNKRRRAVVSLPTGGGKTRVTVEAAVRLVLAPPSARRSVVWVAQTDELCEQAVQAFREVWVNEGAERTDLRIVRLWGGNPNPTKQKPDQPIVVVASIQTLSNRIGGVGLEWLQIPGLVVVDECHHAIAPSYTQLLRWLDAEAPRPGAPEKDEPPIIGLSATPFRTDVEERQRLARRFDSHWLPAEQEQLYTRLQARGVLARRRDEALDWDELTDDEQNQLNQIPTWEGLDFDRLLEAINQRLAGDQRRNERLLQCIQNSAERSILFFANSKSHAEEMAARLNLAGVAAAAVSGETPRAARRWFLDQFQRGDIRVLCNHSVLTTGFDAPRTDMVLIARQVFSPVRYMQMVGRGLRGEKNGGTASCRIVTVIVNLGRFQDRHPYHYCSNLYKAAT